MSGFPGSPGASGILAEFQDGPKPTPVHLLNNFLLDKGAFHAAKGTCTIGMNYRPPGRWIQDALIWLL